MEQPVFAIGSLKRFSEFISKLDESKVVIVSHTDLDGISSAKIVNECVHADEILFVNYDELSRDLDKRLESLKPSKVIFTDLFFKNDAVIKEIEKFADILIIDHHVPERDLNSERTVHLNAQGYCAAYICYALFSGICDLKKWDWLVAAASIADVQYHQNNEFMKSVFSRYGEDFIPDESHIEKTRVFRYSWNISLALFCYSNNLKEVFDTITDFEQYGNLKTGINAVQADYEEQLSKFEKSREKFFNDSTGEGYFCELNPRFNIISILSTTLSFREKNKTFVFLSRIDGMCRFSARRQDGGADLNLAMSKLCSGIPGSSAGGHKKSAGGSFSAEYIDEFKKRLGLSL